jgi:radical SAM superfamily enzyme YgiQ (UPF0313 family)
MNILLLYPEYPDTFWSFKHVMSFARSKAAYPPLGLLTIASMLPAEWNKKLIDMNIRDLKDEDILKADMVFISAMIVQKESAFKVIKRCKELNKKVVAGGPLFMSYKGNFEHVDHLVLGEAETSLPIFLKDLEEGNAKQIYESKERPDITKTPLPMWSLIRTKDYAMMLVQYSRGCPFDCEFCDIVVMNGRVPRVKTSEQMISEFQLLYDEGWRGRIFIVDDNFIGNKAHVMNMMAALTEWQKKHRYPFSFLTQVSINLAEDPELMKAMSEVNFYQVFVGIESPDEDSLQECGKKQNVKSDLTQAIKTMNNNGLQVMGGFIVGFDSDKENVFDQQIAFIQKAGIVTAMVGILAALPGTRLWERLKKENRVRSDSSGDNLDGESNIIPLIGVEKLQAGYKKVLVDIYSKKNYYNRINTLMKNYKPTVKGKYKLNDLYAIGRTFWKIGILSKGERRLFWKTILKTSFTKPRALPDVFTCVIFGFHFHTVVKKL